MVPFILGFFTGVSVLGTLVLCIIFHAFGAPHPKR